jgi:hypothetical protein
LSELSVVTNVSTFAVVLTGMATSFALLTVVTFFIGQLFFSPELVTEWVASTRVSGPHGAYGKLALFVASVAMLIGALGATFESNDYFRHVTCVDEEI